MGDRICAWCRPGDLGPPGATHGICRYHLTLYYPGAFLEGVAQTLAIVAGTVLVGLAVGWLAASLL